MRLTPLLLRVLCAFLPALAASLPCWALGALSILMSCKEKEKCDLTPSHYTSSMLRAPYCVSAPSKKSYGGNMCLNH